MLGAGFCAAAWAGQTAVGVIRTGPLPSPVELANLESHVLQNPEDIQARAALLRLYLDTAPPGPINDPALRSVRLQHILYLVEHHPEAPASASSAAYVYRANGPYANLADHEAVRDQWLAAVQAHPKEMAVVMNAVRFLEIEDPDDAERALRSARDADPGKRELAANLGFQYAKEILGSDPDLARRATLELEQNSDALVLAAAGTALPNLAMRASAGRMVDPKIFELASAASARARSLAPDDPDLKGPMPLIQYFINAQAPPPNNPSRIRIAEPVQAANLIRRTDPRTPGDARVSGQVKLSAVIGRDGTVQQLQLISGDPLLVQAAMQAVKTWMYKPVLLNGSPVEVETTITVSFPAN